jgi:adenylate kinase family enzyme
VTFYSDRPQLVSIDGAAAPEQVTDRLKRAIAS